MDRQVNHQNIILLSIFVWFVIILRCLNSCQAAGLLCNSNSSLPSIWIRNRCQNRLVKNNFETLSLASDHFSKKSLLFSVHLIVSVKTTNKKNWHFLKLLIVPLKNSHQSCHFISFSSFFARHFHFSVKKLENNAVIWLFLSLFFPSSDNKSWEKMCCGKSWIESLW